MPPVSSTSLQGFLSNTTGEAASTPLTTISTQSLMSPTARPDNAQELQHSTAASMVSPVMPGHIQYDVRSPLSNEYVYFSHRSAQRSRPLLDRHQHISNSSGPYGGDIARLPAVRRPRGVAEEKQKNTPGTVSL